MANMKIISIMDAENRAQATAIKHELYDAIQLSVVSLEDEIVELRERIRALEQKVTEEGVHPKQDPDAKR
jgi:predicted  nucleic acid-binding Zn-ribbon protein